MDDNGGLGGTYDKLICQEDFNVDEASLYSNQENQQVSMSILRHESSVNRPLAVSLAVLAFILLAVDIGLGVYYRQLSDGQRTISDISSELTKLQGVYNNAILSRDEAKKQLAKEISEQQITKWELEHHQTRSKDYENRAEKAQMEIAALNSYLLMISEGCRHCLPGWTLIGSGCYYFAFSDALVRRSWTEARNYCKKQGADLVVTDSREKHLAINDILNKRYQNPSRFIALSGFWIGLRDVEVEGTWRWLDGTLLNEGYWNDGEPNNQGQEDCAATYPRDNPFKAWNDAPCTYGLKWICEMRPWSAS